jgi:hypothetical protein
MKKIIALLLIAFSIFSMALAEQPAQDVTEISAEETVAEETAAEETGEVPEEDTSDKMVRGFVIDNDVFFALEETFRMTDFSGEMSSVDLSETQTLVFDSKPVDRLLPTLSVTLSEADPFSEDADELASTLGSIIGVMQYLQEQFPDTFLFNDEMASEYETSGLGYLVAEPELWLWPDSAGAVFIPVCFYENARGTLVDDMYLLEVLAVEDGGLCYILYNDPQRVADYMEHVTVNADASAFQYALAFWYLKNYMLTAIDIEQEEGAAGMLRVLNTLCFVREFSDSSSRIVSRVKRGEWYPVLSIAENGWYEIRLTDGSIGYISSNLVEFFPREMPALQETEEGEALEGEALEGAADSPEVDASGEETEGAVLEDLDDSMAPTEPLEPLTPAEASEATE